MRIRSLLVSLLVIVLTFPALAGTIGPDLKEAMIFAGPDDLLPVVVMMEEYPARGELLAEVRGLNREARRRHVVSTLKGIAERSQHAVHEMLAAESDEVRNVRRLWGINGVALDATPGVIEQLATLPGIRWLMHDGNSGRPANAAAISMQQQIAGSSDSAVNGTGPTGGDISGPNPDATVRGEVIAMGAQQVWEELGYTGAGVIVAVIDTGVDPTHPDLADHIWTNLDEVAGNGIDDDSNGYIDDTWGWDICENDNVPDSGAHGTQCAGQVAGDGTDGTVTGMAPDAEIMVVGINCSPPDSIGWQASDYAIDNGADIITESYIWPWEEDIPDFEGWRRQMDAELAAGIIHSTAAGNDGDSTIPAIPYNVSTPANCPPPWLHPDQTIVGGLSSTLTVGNIDWNTDIIAPSSSRGPVAWEDITLHTYGSYPHTLTPEWFDYPYENGAQAGLIKPEISAYGNGTYTTCPGAYYCSFSGTSSATPHVAGAMALMLQANAEATPGELAEALMTTAEHRGDPGMNNDYGTGLLQAYEAVLAVESSILYLSHTIDDGDAGNGDMMLDPGETVVMEITVESRSDFVVDGLEGILTTLTPGVTIHNQHATFPSLPARGTALSNGPHYSLTVDPGACTNVITFDLEVRYAGKVRRSSFNVRIGEPETVVLLDDDFEADLGWTIDDGSCTQGFWVREDPIGVLDGQSRPSNPEDDTSDPGNSCWVTGNGELTGKKDENNNDVDGGLVTLTSPPFGLLHMLSLELTYDRWYYDVDSGNSFTVEVSNDGGLDWTAVEEWIYSAGGWYNSNIDLFALLSPTDDMLLRFIVEDEGVDDPVEGAVDEVLIEGVWVSCQPFDPPAALPPNPVGYTLMVDKDAGGHAELTWDAPPVDGGHDPATLYRMQRALAPDGLFIEPGSATTTRWLDIDALGAGDSYYYLVTAE